MVHLSRGEARLIGLNIGLLVTAAVDRLAGHHLALKREHRGPAGHGLQLLRWPRCSPGAGNDGWQVQP